MWWPGLRRQDSLARGFVAYWALWEKAGSRAGDLVNGNHGTLIGPPTWAASEVGPVLAFDGSDQWVDFGAIAAITVTGTYTMTVRFKANDTAGNYVLLANINGTNDRNFLKLQADELIVNAYDGSHNTKSVAFTDTTLWHHLVLVNKNMNVTGYLDGAEITGGTTRGASGGTVGRIGADGGTLRFDGQISEAVIWLRTLTPSEIQTLYNFPNRLITPVSRTPFVSEAPAVGFDKLLMDANLGADLFNGTIA
jgi:hypothetical protein